MAVKHILIIMTHLTVKSRFCPSPTGYIHLGNMRTALFSALCAAHAKGSFILRMEDTDPERSKQIFVEALQEDLQWMQLFWQEGPGIGGDFGPYFQSQRQSIYDDYYIELEKKNLVYPCFCSEDQLALRRKVQRAAGQAPRYAGTCRGLLPEEVERKLAEGLKPTLRFRMPGDEKVTFQDIVRGEQSFNTSDLGDLIIRRADGTAPFMFCNAIDDALMGVNYVLRGEDHLTNTPRQILILKALNLPIPTYAHISMIVGQDGTPLSKRHGSYSAQELRKEGYLPLAVLNYLARLGHYYSETHLMSWDALAESFKLSSLSKAPAKFDIVQLKHWQKEAVQALSVDEFWAWVGEEVAFVVPKEKQTLFAEMAIANITFPEEAKFWAVLLFKETNIPLEEHMEPLKAAGARFFQSALDALASYGNDFQLIAKHCKENCQVKGKALFQPLRLVSTGQLHGPEMSILFSLLGKEMLLKRFTHALQLLGDVAL